MPTGLVGRWLAFNADEPRPQALFFTHARGYMFFAANATSRNLRAECVAKKTSRIDIA